jgi:rod shape-determining protein MreC
MPLGTLNATPPPFFRQGPSALSKLIFFSALALFLMVADVRFKIVQPLRVVVATALYPVQWLMLRPVLWLRDSGQYFESLKTSRSGADAAYLQLNLQSQRAHQVEQLTLENSRLRLLLGLRERLTTKAQTAQVLYDAADSYTRKVIIDRGSFDSVLTGSPVLDETGILGQVTRVYPLVSEVTLVTDREQATPVLNTRTGERGVAFGDPALHANAMELRFSAANADVQVGDLLTTSGIDGVYPSGLRVARVSKVERRVDSAFARIICLPQALVAGVSHVLVLQPLVSQIAARPSEPTANVAPRKGAKK